jgi:hypothetical protein
MWQDLQCTGDASRADVPASSRLRACGGLDWSESTEVLATLVVSNESTTSAIGDKDVRGEQPVRGGRRGVRLSACQRRVVVMSLDCHNRRRTG